MVQLILNTFVYHIFSGPYFTMNDYGQKPEPISTGCEDMVATYQKILNRMWTGIFFFVCVVFVDWSKMTFGVVLELEDVLTPYPHGFHGSPNSERFVRDCQPIQYGNTTTTNEISHGLHASRITLPISTTKQFMDNTISYRPTFGRLTVVNDPLRTLSVLEPYEIGGCSMGLRVPVTQTLLQKNCLVAVNAGFFNTHTGDCYGNVVSDGRLAKNAHGVQNAHFGIRANGSLVFGYLSESDVLDQENPFVQLIGGVGWLLRDGEIYIEESKKAECHNSEETGSLERFFDVVAARTAVGSDNKGRIVLAHVDGKAESTGVSLQEFAELLQRNGVVNAINLDGGGSSTFVINGTVVNHSTDQCEDRIYRCPRAVSTILCVHKPDCDPCDCSGHGECVLGECHCRGNWQKPKCDTLMCGSLNCSSHGTCTETGCKCNRGYTPPDCKQLCGAGAYGQDCLIPCQCEHGGDCDPVTGKCSCLPGYTGRQCEQICPYGYHGPECREQCKCKDSVCPCHHLTGLCAFSNNDTTYANLLNAGQCLANSALNSKNLVPSKTFFQDSYAVGFVVATTIATLSLMCNIALFCHRCTCRVSSRPFPTFSEKQTRKYRMLRQRDLDFENSAESESGL